MKKKSNIQTAANKLTQWVGSPTSVIIHTLFFTSCFLAVWLAYIQFEQMLLLLTTIVSLEAIYLSIFIQMSINFAAADIEEIQEDVEDIQEDVEELQEDIEEIQEDVGEISEDVGEMQEDVDELQEDLEEITEEEVVEKKRNAAHDATLATIQDNLSKLMAEIEQLKSAK